MFSVAENVPTPLVSLESVKRKRVAVGACEVHCPGVAGNHVVRSVERSHWGSKAVPAVAVAGAVTDK